MKAKMYLCCCGAERGRVVIIGRSEVEPKSGETIRLSDARMVLRWDAACGGLLGLAAKGPKGSTSITAAVSATEAKVHEWTTVEAESEVDAWPAC